jgi:hypothetical protein
MPDTRYTPELAAEICRRMAEGESLRGICRDPGMPPEATVRTWSRDDRDGFAAQYHQARLMQIDCWVDEIVETACRDDLDPQDKRVRCDAYKWVASKIAPKRFGDRLLVAGDAESPLQMMHQRVDLKALTNEQLKTLEAMCEQMILLEHKVD